MACGGALSPVMMIAGAGIIPGVSIPGVGAALGVAPGLTSAIGSFTSLPITSEFSNIVTAATSVLGSGTLDSLRTLGANIMPALTNAIPGGFTSALSAIAPGGLANGGLTGLVNTMATNIMGSGDLGQFAQVFNAAQGFSGLTNSFINGALNTDSLASTFGSLTGGMDSLMSGSFSQVTEALGSFGGDLANLGNLIDMKNLANLGNPTALVQQLASVGGLTASVQGVLQNAGLDLSNIASLASGALPNLADTVSKSLYEGMTQITGANLAQVKNILGVTTPNIGSMADLLNPAKILPTSFPSLTMPTPEGLRGIYADVSGTVNSNLEKYVLSSRDFVATTPALIDSAKQKIGSTVNQLTTGITGSASKLTSLIG